MSRKGFFLAVAILFVTACLAQAEEQTSTTSTDQTAQTATAEKAKPSDGSQPASDGKLHATFAGTYLSKFIWRGFDLYNGHGAIQPSVDVDLWGTGFGISTYYSKPISGEPSDEAWIPSTVYYHNGLFKDEIYAINYVFGFSYFNYPGTSWRNFDMYEAFGRFCFPKLFPFGIVPSYTFVYDTPASSNSMQVNGAGFAHVFGLAYDWALPAILPDTTEQIIHLTWETVYNDGVGPGNPAKPEFGRKVDHDWSHQVFGISTDIPIVKNLFFVPAFYYQNSWDSSVNQQDETWVSLALKYSF
jgi:hypothetical protein